MQKWRKNEEEKNEKNEKKDKNEKKWKKMKKWKKIAASYKSVRCIRVRCIWKTKTHYPIIALLRGSQGVKDIIKQAQSRPEGPQPRSLVLYIFWKLWPRAFQLIPKEIIQVVLNPFNWSSKFEAQTLIMPFEWYQVPIWTRDVLYFLKAITKTF